MIIRCIYCLEEKSAESFSKSEHVVPQSFGRFKHNLTLRNVICDDCNQYFGDNLEVELGRDTFEGEARFHHGVKDSHEYKSVGERSRLIRRFVEGPFKGAYFYVGHSNKVGKIVALPCPQIGFLKKDGHYEYFLLDNIPAKEFLEKEFPLRLPQAL